MAPAGREVSLYWEEHSNFRFNSQSVQVRNLTIFYLFSLSFDDSLSNKVLVLATANQEKGQRTPFHALDSMDDAWSYREFKSYVKESKLLSNKKKEYPF